MQEHGIKNFKYILLHLTLSVFIYIKIIKTVEGKLKVLPQLPRINEPYCPLKHYIMLKSRAVIDMTLLKVKYEWGSF